MNAKENKLQIKQNTLEEILNDVTGNRYEDQVQYEGKPKEFFSSEIKMIGNFFSNKNYFQYIKLPDGPKEIRLTKNKTKDNRHPELHTQVNK
jgi:hypothetical protein